VLFGNKTKAKRNLLVANLYKFANKNETTKNTQTHKGKCCAMYSGRSY
jgi:hypothetical protein